MLPSSIAGSKGTRQSAPPPSGDLTLTSGVQGVQGPSGLTYIYSGDSDDYYYKIPALPFDWYFMGTNYGQNANNGIYIGTNGYITFGFGTGTLSMSATTGRSILFAYRDRRLYQAAGGQDPDVGGVANYRVYWRGTTYGRTSESLIIEFKFFANNYFQINYGTMNTSSSGQAYISNGSSYVNSWTVPTYSSSSFAFSSDPTGTNWTVQSGYWS